MTEDTSMRDRPVFPLLLSMALPMVISMAVNALYNIVDSFFVAKISEDALTALSLVYPVQNFVNAVSIGFGVGISAVIAYFLGAGDSRKADAAATQGTVLAAAHGIILTVLTISLMPAFLGMFTTDRTILGMGREYSTIVFAFSLINTLDLSFEKIYQAVGRMKVTMIALLIGAVSNIILDPLFIWGIGFFPQLGIRGAALATGLGQSLTMVFYLIIYRARPMPVRLRRNCMKLEGWCCRRLYSVGVPATLNLALPSLLISVLNAILASFSQDYVLVLGVYYKLQTFLYLPANGIVQGMRPVIGYNYGAKEHARVRKIYLTTLAMIAVIMAIGTVLCQSISGWLIGLFTSTPEIVTMGSYALRIISIGFLISSLSITSSGALEGLSKGTLSLVISLLRYVVVILPVAFLFSRIWGADGVWHAFWVTEIVAGAVSLLIYRHSIAGIDRSGASS